MTETPTPTPTEQTLPAGPSNARQQRYLATLIQEGGELRDKLIAIRDGAISDLADVEAGKYERLGFGNGGYPTLAADVLRLRAKIETRIESFRAYDLEPEQINYAMLLAGMDNNHPYLRDERESAWLYSVTF